MSRKLAAIAAASLVFASTAAYAAPRDGASPVAKLSLDSGKRVGTKSKNGSGLSSSGTIVAAVILMGAVTWGIVEATDGPPSSP